MRIENKKIPLYGGELVMIQCENWKKLKEVYKSDLEKYSNQPDERHDGYVFEASLPNGGTQYVVAFKGVPKGSVIAHECVHLVNNIYANCVIQLDIYNDEHQAYLLEWFFDQIDTFFNDFKRKMRKQNITFTLISGEKCWPLKLGQSPRGIRNGDKRPNAVIIDCCEIADIEKLHEIIQYLETIKLAMR